MTAMNFGSRADGLLRRVLVLPDGALASVVRRRVYVAGELLLTEADRLPGEGPESGKLAGHVVEAAWDLRALLHTLDEAATATEPRPGEWSVAEALDHMLGAQRFWNVLFGIWGEQARAGRTPEFRPDGELVKERLASDDRLVTAPEALIAELDALVATGCAAVSEAEELGVLHEPEVGFNRGSTPVQLAYYPRRWAAHLREHTIQIEKTLVWLQREPSEQERMARFLAGAIGSLEAAWWRAGRPDGLEAALEPAERHLTKIEEEIQTPA